MDAASPLAFSYFGGLAAGLATWLLWREFWFSVAPWSPSSSLCLHPVGAHQPAGQKGKRTTRTAGKRGGPRRGAPARK
jgi:hypothetical protein